MLFRTSASLLSRRRSLLALAVVLLSLGCTGPRSESRGSGTSAPVKVDNGLYAVIGEPIAAPQAPDQPNQRQLRYDPRMADSESTEPVQFVTVETSSYVPLILATAPEHTTQDDGRILISVALAPQHIQTLAAFTRSRLGQRVALVLDGEVMSTHKVRTAIEGGRLQITRCDAHACQRILSKLADTHDAAKSQ